MRRAGVDVMLASCSLTPTAKSDTPASPWSTTMEMSGSLSIAPSKPGAQLRKTLWVRAES